MCKVYLGYHGTSEIEHGLCACTVAKARGLSLRAATRHYGDLYLQFRLILFLTLTYGS